MIFVHLHVAAGAAVGLGVLEVQTELTIIVGAGDGIRTMRNRIDGTDRLILAVVGRDNHRAALILILALKLRSGIHAIEAAQDLGIVAGGRFHVGMVAGGGLHLDLEAAARIHVRQRQRLACASAHEAAALIEAGLMVEPVKVIDRLLIVRGAAVVIVITVELFIFLADLGDRLRAGYAVGGEIMIALELANGFLGLAVVVAGDFTLIVIQSLQSFLNPLDHAAGVAFAVALVVLFVKVILDFFIAHNLGVIAADPVAALGLKPAVLSIDVVEHVALIRIADGIGVGIRALAQMHLIAPSVGRYRWVWRQNIRISKAFRNVQKKYLCTACPC